ncbi:MAG: HAD family hydrolase [Deltaproteobacteria bacterium]|jgi:phosphoglycolate phosphatase|nr:HAD family hydrolase [Deltaproteobacteria bacterium]
MKDVVIIWDWNGTLLNDVSFCVDRINDLLVKREMKRVSIEEYRKKFTFPVADYYREIGLLDNDNYADIGIEFIVKYFAGIGSCPLREDAVSVLKYFSDNNVRQYILSAMQHDKLVELVKQFKIEHYFEDVRGIDNHYADGKKGAAEVLKSELGSESVWFIGDTIHDYEISQVFEGRSVLLKGGHQSVDRLHTCKGAIVLDDIADLRECIAV